MSYLLWLEGGAGIGTELFSPRMWGKGRREGCDGERGREGRNEEGRGGREGRREGRKEEGREGGREGGRNRWCGAYLLASSLLVGGVRGRVG